MKKFLTAVFCCAALLLCGGEKEKEKMENNVFVNPVLLHGADPWIGLIDGKYYAAVTCDTGIELRCAGRIAGLGKSKPVRIFTGVEKSDHFCQFWAPELHRIDGVWYCYFTASDGDIHHHKMFVLRSRSETLPGKWEFAGALTDEKDGWCIDGTVFCHNGRRYMVYAHGGKMGEELVIRPMPTPEKLDPKRTVILFPAPEDKKITEGPFQLKTAKHDLLVFSACGSHTDDYQLSALELTGDDPMDVRSWKRLDRSFMTKSGTEFGPGHCTFFTDGAGDIFVSMQVIPKSGGGWAARTVWVQKLLMDEQGYPACQVPVRTGVPQKEPVTSKIKQKVF